MNNSDSGPASNNRHSGGEKLGVYKAIDKISWGNEDFEAKNKTMTQVKSDKQGFF